eukprot:tig00000042_g15664.t1
MCCIDVAETVVTPEGPVCPHCGIVVETQGPLCSAASDATAAAAAAAAGETAPDLGAALGMLRALDRESRPSGGLGRTTEATLERVVDQLELPESVRHLARRVIFPKRLRTGRRSDVLAAAAVYHASKALRHPRILADVMQTCPGLAGRRALVLRAIRDIHFFQKENGGDGAEYVPRPGDYVDIISDRLQLPPGERVRARRRAALLQQQSSRSPLVLAGVAICAATPSSVRDVASAAGVTLVGLRKGLDALGVCALAESRVGVES